MKNFISFNQIILATVLLGLHAPSFAAAGDSGSHNGTPNQVADNTELASITSLPPEVLHHIFSFLEDEPFSLLDASATCQEWRSVIAESPELQTIVEKIKFAAIRAQFTHSGEIGRRYPLFREPYATPESFARFQNLHNVLGRKYSTTSNKDGGRREWRLYKADLGNGSVHRYLIKQKFTHDGKPNGIHIYLPSTGYDIPLRTHCNLNAIQNFDRYLNEQERPLYERQLEQAAQPEREQNNCILL